MYIRFIERNPSKYLIILDNLTIGALVQRPSNDPHNLEGHEWQIHARMYSPLSNMHGFSYQELEYTQQRVQQFLKESRQEESGTSQGV